MMLTITVMYSCTLCDAMDEKVVVPARPTEMDVVYWTNNVMGLAIARQHTRLHPTCPAREMKHVKIPVDNAEWIGGPPVQ